ncbi:MAG TPA: hypothetical protein VFR24_23045 [Candidatus Angelobacter sp.]|nr:hypothetical protein [Candidatus Angelobacter sp.]
MPPIKEFIPWADFVHLELYKDFARRLPGSIFSPDFTRSLLGKRRLSGSIPAVSRLAPSLFFAQKITLTTDKH